MKKFYNEPVIEIHNFALYKGDVMTDSYQQPKDPNLNDGDDVNLFP